MTTVGSTDDYIDSLDVIADIEELQEKLAGEPDKWTAREELQDELDILQAFADQGRAFDDWEYGLQFIHEDFFQDFCEEYVRDSGDIDSVPEFIVNAIDWEIVADSMREDYTEVEFDGQVYLTR